MLGMAVVAEGEFFVFAGSGKSQMDIFLVFLFFFRVTASAVYIYEAFSKVNIGIGVCVAIHAGYFAVAVDVLRPFPWVHKKRACLAVLCDLRDVGFSVTKKAILIGKARILSKGAAKEKNEEEEYASF